MFAEYVCSQEAAANIPLADVDTPVHADEGLEVGLGTNTLRHHMPHLRLEVQVQEAVRLGHLLENPLDVLVVNAVLVPGQRLKTNLARLYKYNLYDLIF